ncbi:MAG: Hvo_1808 family surface protein [Halobacteriales archaeon]|nr:Hvo_1808 family surface protein [Halobacteriales archaeon]
MRRTAVLSVAVFFVLVATTAGVTAAEPGVVDGYEPDDEFDFDRPIEGEELEAVVSRTMARVEVIRDREFEGRPTVRLVERGDVPGADGEGVNTTAQGDWNDVVWEALLVIGEDEYANQVISDTVGGATAGFYDTGDGQGEGNGTAEKTVSLVGRVHEPTLAHELVHVMQDQQYNLSAERFRPPVQDEQLASQGVVEGEAEYIRFVYEERCATEWECYERTSTTGAGSGFDGNVGLLMTLIHPYSDGPEYVHRLREEDGWDAVEEKYDDVPTTSSEIIHAEKREAAEVEFENEATDGWSLYDAGRDGYDVAGEASIFVTFWYQSSPTGYDLGVIETFGFFSGRGEYARYDYTDDVSEGWRGDRIYPYHRETDDGNETGFVWKSAWETQEDAVEFADAYLSVLDRHDAERLDGATRVVEGDFRGAYRVSQEGTNVTVVRAPTVEGLDELRPSASDAERPTELINARPRPEPTPGFGVFAVFVALSVVAVRLRAST